MAFYLGDKLVTEVLYGLATNITTSEPLYVLTQLSEAQISITADYSDITDKDGNVVYRKFRSKQGEFSATNAFWNLNVTAAAGADTELASATNILTAPKIIKVAKSAGAAVLENVVSGSITVSQYFGDGRLGKNYALGVTASDTEYAITTGSTTVYTFPDVTAAYVVEDAKSSFPTTGDASKKYIDKATGKVWSWDTTLDTPDYVEFTGLTAEVVATLPTTGAEDKLYVVTGDNTVHSCTVTVTPDGTTTVSLPTDPEATFFLIKFNRTFTSGGVIKNSAKTFPDSVNMLLKVLYVDPCSKDEEKAAYVEMPSFKMSPETTLSFSPETPTMDITASLEIDYCSDDKEIFNVYFVDEVDAD